MQRLALFLIVILIPSALADQHSTYWPKDKLAGYSSSLDAKVKDHVAIEELGQFGSHFALMVHRTGTGTSESHAGDTDFYVVQAGEATLHVGGEIVEPETVSPGEGAGHVAQGRPDHGPQGWRYGEHSADDGGRLRRRGQDRDVEQRPRPMVPEPAAPLDPRRSTTMRWKPTYRKLTRPALWFVAAVASGVGAASLAAPGPAEEPVSTRCLAEKGSKAGGGYLDRIKRLSPSIGRISGDVMPMVLVPREAPVSNTEERLIGAAPLVKDRVVLLFFEEHPEGYASLSGTVVRQFAEAGARPWLLSMPRSNRANSTYRCSTLTKPRTISA